MNNWDINKTTEENYLTCCKEAFEDEEIFNNFKQDPRYTEILEHVSYENGISLIEEIKNYNNTLTKEIIAKAKENDLYGNSTRFNYENFGSISPSTIRYIKNSLDILNKFSDKPYNNVVEIGGGYGGLCKVLHDFIPIKNYTIIDLYEPVLLAQKYLNLFDIKVSTHIPTDDLIYSTNEIDLLISNYAFSELTITLQKNYIEKVISKAKKFYIIYNNISNSNLNYENFILFMSSKTPRMKIEIETDYQNNKILYGYVDE